MLNLNICQRFSCYFVQTYKILRYPKTHSSLQSFVIKPALDFEQIKLQRDLLPNCCSTYITSASRSSKIEFDDVIPESVVSKLRRKLGLPMKYTHTKRQLGIGGMKLYSCCVESSNYSTFFRDFDLPDTLVSWFLVMELHVWFVMLRLARMGHNGVYIRKIMMEMMWTDLENRCKTFKEFGYFQRRDDMMELYYQFCGAMLAYDEGILSDDKTLAASVWRTMFDKEEVDPRHVATVVEYIRKQAQFMLEQPEVLFIKGEPRFLPLYGSVVDEELYQSIVKRL